MKTYFPVLLLVGLFFSAFTLPMLFSWEIDEDYLIQFKGSGAKGTFSGLTGKISFDPNNLDAAAMKVSVDATSISTGNKTKDKHARGKNWFDVAQYPRINFQSSSFRKTDSGYEVVGMLSLRGVTKEVVIPFTFESQGNSGRFQGTFAVDRKDYGIKGNFFGFSVGKTFQVDLNVPVNIGG